MKLIIVILGEKILGIIVYNLYFVWEMKKKKEGIEYEVKGMVRWVRCLL